MATKVIRAMRMAALCVVILILTSCGSAPTAPTASTTTASTITPASTVVMAPPPAGVSATMWRLAFLADSRLYLADKVALVLPGSADQAARDAFAAVVKLNNVELDGKTLFSVGTTGNFEVRVTPNLKCGGVIAAACTTLKTDETGKITGGVIEFTSVNAMADKNLVMHETLCRANGVILDNREKGICNPNPWDDLQPSAEEKAMLRGRYLYPPLSVYSAQ